METRSKSIARGAATGGGGGGGDRRGGHRLLAAVDGGVPAEAVKAKRPVIDDSAVGSQSKRRRVTGATVTGSTKKRHRRARRSRSPLPVAESSPAAATSVISASAATEASPAASASSSASASATASTPSTTTAAAAASAVVQDERVAMRASLLEMTPLAGPSIDLIAVYVGGLSGFVGQPHGLESKYDEWHGAAAKRAYDLFRAMLASQELDEVIATASRSTLPEMAQALKSVYDAIGAFPGWQRCPEISTVCWGALLGKAVTDHVMETSSPQVVLKMDAEWQTVMTQYEATLKAVYCSDWPARAWFACTKGMRSDDDARKFPGIEVAFPAQGFKCLHPLQIITYTFYVWGSRCAESAMLFFSQNLAQYAVTNKGLISKAIAIATWGIGALDVVDVVIKKLKSQWYNGQEGWNDMAPCKYQFDFGLVPLLLQFPATALTPGEGLYSVYSGFLDFVHSEMERICGYHR